MYTVTIPVPTVQCAVYSADAMWWYEAFAHFERERQSAGEELMRFVKLRLTESFQIIV